MHLATQDGPHDFASMKINTTLKREHHFQQKCAPRCGESTAARPKKPVRGVPARQKHWFFMGECKKAHHAAARARFSKGAQRSSENSIVTTHDGAHDLPSKENEHRAEAGAPFSFNMRTALRREHRGALPVRHLDTPHAKVCCFYSSKRS